MVFDRDAFANLLIKAKGFRSQRKYADACGVDNSLISRYMRKLHDTPPESDTIQKLAAGALNNNVTFEELMLAAGYMRHPSSYSNSEVVPQLPACFCDLSFLDSEIREWVKTPENEEFLKFAFMAHNKGISKEVLGYAQLTIDVND